MEWHDATGAVFNGIDNPAVVVSPRFPDGVQITNMVQPGVTDASGGPFPGGFLRLRNVGVDRGEAFDVLVTVPAAGDTTFASDMLPVRYLSPTESFVSQATVTATRHTPRRRSDREDGAKGSTTDGEDGCSEDAAATDGGEGDGARGSTIDKEGE